MKCREHGLAALPPQFRLTLPGVVAAVPAVLVLSAVSGFVALRIPFFLASIGLALVGGWLIAEAAWFTAGRKRGPQVAALTAATVLVGGTAGTIFLLALSGGRQPAFRDLMISLMVPQVWIFAAIASFTAYGRLR